VPGFCRKVEEKIFVVVDPDKAFEHDPDALRPASIAISAACLTTLKVQ
jgi:hypothetical protein